MNSTRIEMEHELMKKDLKKYEIGWVKYYWDVGTTVIKASTEEEAIQIAKENICDYQGHFEWDFDKNEFESLGEVKE